MFDTKEMKINWGGKELKLETGKVARQATGSVMVTMGGTVVLCAVVAQKEAKKDVDFFPLTVHHQERFYSAGKIPGGFNKRESRPTEREVLTSRLIDRPIRPLFKSGFFNEVQVVTTVLSYDPENQPDILALIGTSAALAISGIPFDGPIGAARVGYKDGQYTLNPSAVELADGSQLDLVVSGTDTAVLMVESEAQELSEDVMLGAVMFGHESYRPIIKAISEFAEQAGKPRWEVNVEDHSQLKAKVKKLAQKKIQAAYNETEKQKRHELLGEAKAELKKALVETGEHPDLWVNYCFKALEADIVRSDILDKGKRIDMRKTNDIRQISTETNFLPNVHGSALFTRGETQALVAVTLGTGQDEQVVDDIEGDRKEKFLLHYNFPSYSVGEVGQMRAPGRREIGHGKLAFRSINGLLPSKEEFPYTIRVVSEITESNGSSSMATVCGTSMALMAAGVPIKSPVAGIAMGLILEGTKFEVLSDIMGDEDHLGDMDFKVAGTKKGITALQMDIKISGITEEIMHKALEQANVGRLHILGEMGKTIQQYQNELASHAPQIRKLTVPKDRIGEIIGPGGKIIKDIIEKTKVKIDISDDGTVLVAATSSESMEAGLAMINDIIAVPEVGTVYQGKVVRVVDFGAFVGVLKNCEGLVHVSEMADYRVRSPRDLVKEGDIVSVKVIEVDRSGKVKLTMKGLNDDIITKEAPVAKASAEGEVASEQQVRPEASEGSSGDRPRRNDRKGDNRKGHRSDRRDNNRERPQGRDRAPNRERRSDADKHDGQQANHESYGVASAFPSAKKRRFF